MEEKAIKQIKTQLPFPLLIYKTRIKYNEVRKASGISYILLELISKQSSDIRFSKALSKFGIPTDLHSLFGKEIAGLIGTEILQLRYSASHFENPRYFGEIKLNEVALTEKGKKLFREGAIPTGQEGHKTKDVFFSPVTRKFDVQSSVSCSPLASCFLGEEFLDRVEIDIGGLEDWLNANTTKVGLKAEERMISFETEEPQKMNVRTEDNLTINIYPSKVEFTFATSDEKVFFDKYYSSAIVAQGMLMKDKFKFPGALELSTVTIGELNDIKGLYLPNEFLKQAIRPCVVFLSKENVDIVRNDVICVEKNFSRELLDVIDGNAEFALLDKSGCKYYCAVNVEMPCENFGDTFTLPLLVEREAVADIFTKIIDRLYSKYAKKPFDNESARIVLYTVDSLSNSDYFSDFIEKNLQPIGNTDGQIEALLKLNSAFKRHASWNTHFVKAATGIYRHSIGEVSIENVIYKNTVLTPLKEALNISEAEYVREFSENMRKTESAEIVFEALSSAGFTDTAMLSVANVVEIFMAAVLENGNIISETDLATKYKTLRKNLWELNEMLGIEDSSAYTIKDDYNVDAFFNAYGTLQTAAKAIEKYRQFALKEYANLGRYLAVFEPIHELLSIERTSSSHPEKITKQYIDGYIARGKYKDAICDLLVKLQYDLRKLLNADSTIAVNVLIDDAKGSRLIDRVQADKLHKLRMCRNGFQHPESDKQIPFDKPTIESWRDIVFTIGEQK